MVVTVFREEFCRCYKTEDSQEAKRNQPVAIGIDGFLLFTHRDVSIAGLSVEQVKDIFKGKITNWKQVGGPNLAITAFGFNPKFGSSLNILLGPESPLVCHRRNATRIALVAHDKEA